MGCSSSCLTFETFGKTVEWIARNKVRIDYILHILDDYLLVAPTEQLCQQQLDLFLSLCSYLGIPIAPDKTCGPSTTMSFADIELDTIFIEALLPFPPQKGHLKGGTVPQWPLKFCLFIHKTRAGLFKTSD